jgi:hypothetical protein
MTDYLEGRARLTDQIDEIAGRHNKARESEKQAAIEAHFKALFPFLESVKICKGIHINGFTAKVATGGRDQYLNMTFDISKRFPVELLEPFAMLVEMSYERGEKHQYRYRGIGCFLIEYWRKFYKELTAEEAIQMLEIADRLPCESNRRQSNGFRAYLTTRSYLCVDGGAVNHFDFRDWPERNKFHRLFSETVEVA